MLPRMKYLKTLHIILEPIIILFKKEDICGGVWMGKWLKKLAQALQNMKLEELCLNF